MHLIVFTVCYLHKNVNRWYCYTYKFLKCTLPIVNSDEKNIPGDITYMGGVECTLSFSDITHMVQYWFIKVARLFCKYIIRLFHWIICVNTIPSHWCHMGYETSDWTGCTLEWRYNERHGVSNHQQLDELYYLFTQTSNQTSKFACERNPPVNSHKKGQGPVLLTFLRHVARISANGIAAFKESCSPIG